MGVAAVSATLNIADITYTQIENKLAERDKPYIVPYLDTESGFDRAEITDADQVALKRSIPEIRSISTIFQVFIQTVQFEDREVKEIEAFGVSQNFIDTTGRRILQGRFFNPVDFAQYRPVAIVDQRLATTLFKQQSPINQPIYAYGNRLIVVGVVETKSEGQEYRRTSGALWLTKPLAESFATFGWNALQISPHRLEEVPVLETKVKQILERRHPRATAFSFGNTQDLVKERELHQTSSRALAIVGLIALGIGGVGIANITIAAVLERTKEIGLRRAIGATRLEIMLQFILESVILSILGGAAAIASVHGLTQFTTTKIIQAPYTFSWHNAALSMGAAIGVGVGSSFFPALRATQINVVTALRE